ncbi:MAG: hypothetical protein ACTSP8_04460 [Promethearchaeota archaeon]
MVTDLDVWAGECQNCGVVEIKEYCENCGGPVKKLAVSLEEILNTMEKNSVNLMQMLELTIPKIDFENECTCKHSLSGSIM